MTEAPSRSGAPFGPLLIPYDGSPPARVAASLGARLAAADGRDSHLLYVGNEAPQLLVEAAAEFQTPAWTHIVAGEVDTVIVAEAERLDAGLILLGSRGRAVLSGLLFGSTARAVLRGCHRPTLVVHEDSLARLGRGSPAGGRGPIIVAAIEAAPSAPVITANARQLADALDGTVALVTIHNVDADIAKRPAAYGIPPREWEEQLRSLQERTFGPVRHLAGPDATESVRVGVPAEQLRNYANEIGAAIIVAGRRGTSGADVDTWRSVAFALAIQGPFAALIV